MSYTHFSVTNRIMSNIKNSIFVQGTRLHRNYRRNCQAYSSFSKYNVFVNSETAHSSSNKLSLQKNNSLLSRFHWCTKQNVNCKRIGIRPISTIIYLATKPVLMAIAIFGASSLRKRFLRLNQTEREKVLNYLRENVHILFAFLGALFPVACVYYSSHLEETPITKRKRFVSFSPESWKEIAQFEADLLVHILQNKLAVPYDRRLQRVVNVANRLIDNNPDLKKLNMEWKFFLIDRPVVNAAVVSTGHMFICNGILEMCETDDQLAIILGHEMAHAVLKHGIEIGSFKSLVGWFKIIAVAITFCMVNFFSAVCITLALTVVLKLVVFYPVHRKQEWEADHVGLLFAANACYDTREAGVLWRKIALYQKNSLLLIPAWMGTHPDSLKRAEYLDSLMRDADGWRRANGCPPLPKKDPRYK